MKRHSASLYFTILLILLSSVVLVGQTETGTITGTVADVSGAVVPSAKVTATSNSNGSVRSTVTNADGLYTIPSLQPGIYEVRFEASGFSPYTQRVQVTVGSRVGIDPKLKAGATSQTIEVVANAEGVNVNTENQTVGQVISAQSVIELPTITRDYAALALTSGSVAADPGGSTGRGVGVSITGARAAGTSILLDGGENVDYFGAGVGQNVPLDSIQEFSVLTSNFTPEYGRASGGVVNVATKQGTNAVHGSAYEYYRGSGLGANTPENKANGNPRDRYDRNQFGYSVGGPIIKNKLFFFDNTEWIRVRSAKTRQYLVPTPEFIAQADQATQNFFAAYGTLVKPIDAVFTKDQLTVAGSGLNAGSATTPWGDLPGSFPVLGQVTAAVPTDAGGGSPQNSLLGVIRFDYNMTDKTQLFARWGAQRENDFSGSNSDSPYAGYNTGTINRNNNYLLSVVHVFAPTFVSQSKVVYNRLKNLQPVNGPDLPTLFWKGSRAFVLGKFAYLPGYLPGNPGSGIPFGGPQNLYQFYQDFNWSKGHHQWRFGGNYIQIRDNRVFGAYEMAPEQLGANTTDGFNNFLRGQLISFRSAINPQGANACKYNYATNTYIQDASCAINLPATTPRFGRNNRYNDYAFYVNDTWKALDRLSLNLGLRYEYYGVQHNSDPKLDANFYYGSGSNFPERYRNGATQVAPSSPIGGLWKPDRNNFAPRVGFAWDVFGNGKASLRGGFGLFYERNFGNVTFNVIQNPPNYAVVSITPADVGGNLPIYTDNKGPFAGTGATKYIMTPSVRNVSQDIRTAYTETWNLGVERQVATNTLLALTYTGSRGLKLYTLEDYNRLGSGVIYNGDDPTINPLSRMNMQYGVGSYNRGNRGFSYYNGLNVRFQTTNLGKTGLSIVSNYTWSHAIDNLSSTFSDSYYNYNTGLLDPFNPALDKGNADFDVRHRFVFAGNWQEPWLKNSKNAFAKHILGGWEIAPILTASTGTPFTVFDCTNGFFYCPRVFQTGPASKLNRGQSVGANEYAYLSIPTLSAATTYVNPLTGYSEIGNCTVPGQGAAAPCPWPSNMARRNSFRGPNNSNINLGVYKNISITERVKVQLRGEMYNALNHPNAYINSGTIDVSSSVDPTGNVGLVNVKRGFKPDGSSDKRDVQLALRITF
jgi:outer membrane receptor protein involved in Fe transport